MHVHTFLYLYKTTYVYDIDTKVINVLTLWI